jgi:hypothetical protein
MPKVIVVCLLMLAPLAQAQSSLAINVSPAFPRENQDVTISITENQCRTTIGITRTGNDFVIAYQPAPACITTRPFGTTAFSVGALPAGNYTITFVDATDPSIPYATASFAVTANQSIPVLEWRSLVLLAAALAIGAVLALPVTAAR